MARPYSELRKMVAPEIQERATELAQEIIKYMTTDEQIHEDIFAEISRQFQLKQNGKFKYVLSDAEMTDSERLGALTEEFLESYLESFLALTRNVNDKKNRRDELIQVIACCWQWIRHIDTTEKLIK